MRLTFCLLLASHLSVSAQTAQIRWDVQLDRAVQHDTHVWQGETVDLMPRMVQGTTPVAVTNAPVEFRYREAALATNLYRSVAAACSADTGVLSVRWIPDYDAGAAWYDYQFIAGGNAANPRAFGRITMRPTIGWQASTSAPPAVLYYATKADLQAASNALAAALQAEASARAAQDAALSNLVETSVSSIPLPDLDAHNADPSAHPGIRADIAAPGDIAAGFIPPFDEQINISVAQTILKALANHPHSVCCFDYSRRLPAFRVASRLDLPSVSLDISADAESVSITSREDLVPPAVAICFQKPMADGESQWMYTAVDHAPAVEGETAETRNARLSQAGVLWAVYDLAGFSAQYQVDEQSVGVEPLDWDANKTSQAWWSRWCPQLSDPNITAVTISSPSYSGTGEMPNLLLSGVTQEWMEVGTEEETFTADALIFTGPVILPYEIRTEKLIAKLKTTDAVTKTYRRRTLSSADTGDSVPEGLAAQMWSEWQQVHHDGSIVIVQAESRVDIGPGQTLNLVGGRAEWAAMLALVKRVTEGFADGTATVEFGVPQWVDIDSRFAFYRNCRNRRWSFSRNIAAPHDQPELEDGPGSAGINGVPGSRDGGNTTHIIRRVFDNPAAEVAHRVDIYANADLMGFEFATPADSLVARNIRVLEVLLPVDSLGAGKVTGAKRAQVLACAPYGDEVPLDIPGDGGWGVVNALPDPPGPVDFESILWLDGEPVIDLNSAEQQKAPVRLSAVLPLGDIMHYPCKFIAARFPDTGDEDSSLGIVRGRDSDTSHKLKARLAGVDEPPQHGSQNRVYGFGTDDKWNLLELEFFFKLDAANKRIYMDPAALGGNAKILNHSNPNQTWDFYADQTAYNYAQIELVSHVAMSEDGTRLIVSKRTLKLPKQFLHMVSEETTSELQIMPTSAGPHLVLGTDSDAVVRWLNTFEVAL
jgi:hypothetical protein